MAVMVIVAAKLGAVVLGLAIFVLGLGIVRFGGHVMGRLNRLYEHMPGHFQYPSWWNKLLGGMFCGFGLLVAVAGGVLAK